MKAPKNAKECARMLADQHAELLMAHHIIRTKEIREQWLIEAGDKLSKLLSKISNTGASKAAVMGWELLTHAPEKD